MPRSFHDTTFRTQRGSRGLLNANDQALSEHVERFLDARQFGGAPGIEHPPHFLLVASKPSRQMHFGGAPGIEHPPHFLLVASKPSRKMHISHTALSHRKIERRLRRHWRRDRDQPFASRRPGRLRDFKPVRNPSGDRLLQTIRRLPDSNPLSVSLRDGLRNIPERNHQDSRLSFPPKSRRIYERAHGCFLYSKSFWLRQSCLSIL